MKKAKTTLILLLLLPAFMVSIATPGIAAAALRQKGLLDPDNDSTAARITKLVFLLKGMSDDEYGRALTDLPEGAASRPELVSRKAALKSAYTTMAALEYKEAEKEAPEDAGRYSESYQRVAAQDAQAVGIDPETMKATGWANDALKWLANAGINYALQGGTVMVGRSTNKKTAKLEGSLEQLDGELEGAEGRTRAEIRSKKAAVYEQLAADAEPESEADRAAKKKARLKQLAQLLESVSNDEYQEALTAAGPKAAKVPELKKRGKVLKSSYVTLAAMEYRDASKGSPDAGAGQYAKDYQRVSRDGAADLAVNPETLQETGWGTKLFGLAALGGLGYLVYDNQNKKSRNQSSPAPAPRQAECPAGTRSVDGRCLQDAECPTGTKKTDGVCLGDKVCPANTSITGDGLCVGTMSCPEGTRLDNGICLGAITCPMGTRQTDSGQCMGDMICPPERRKTDGGCEGPQACPERTTLTGGVCLADVTCPPGTRKDLGRCLGDITCPTGTRLAGGRCMADRACPAGTKFAGGRCHGPLPAWFPTGLVGEWHFDEASGATALDATGKAAPGALKGGAGWAAGKRGGCLSLPNQGYVAVPHHATQNTSELTIELWIKPTMPSLTMTGISPAMGLVAKRNTNSSTPYVFLINSGGRLSLNWWDSGGGFPNPTSPAVVKLNEWQHVAVTRSATSGGRATITFYLNGAPVSSSTETGLGSVMTSSHDIWIGRDPYFAGLTNEGTYQGLMDEVRIFNVARSAAEILADYEFDTGRPPRRLVPLPYPVPVIRDPKSAALYGSLAILEGQQVGRSLSTEEDADVHHKMGGVYEQLAATSDDEAEEEPAEKPAPAQGKRRAAEPAEAVSNDEQAEEPALPPAPKASRKHRPSKEDSIKREMKDMDDMGKDMQKEFERRKPVAPAGEK